MAQTTSKGDKDRKHEKEERGSSAKAKKSDAPASTAKNEADEEEDDEEDEEDEDGDADEEDEADEDGDADEEDEEDEDGDADEEDEEDEGSATAQDAKRRESSRPRAEEEAGSDDWIPDWAPWVVMLGLIAVGALGALGVFSPRHDRTTAADSLDAAASAARPTGSARADSGDTIEASHILVMHKDSTRKPPTITRTKEEARQRAQEALNKVRSGTPFEQVAGEYTDEPSGKKRGGALGSFKRERMHKQFSDAAFALRPGQVSGIVETPFGFHIIKRTK